MALAIAGCSVGAATPNGAAGMQIPPLSVTDETQAQAQPSPPPVAAQLPFKGRLVDGDPSDLPPAVAAALSDSGTVTFNYREELTHDHYTVPLALSAFDPLTYVGYPLGRYGVTAFASLGISQGDRVIGDYTAKVHVSRDYTLYYQPTYVELERAARKQVRQKIDEKLYRDSGRLAQAANGQSP
ncbi:MAG: hypothetical protein ACLQU2_11960 [Candidatus Binataceae bacterium]